MTKQSILAFPTFAEFLKAGVGATSFYLVTRIAYEQGFIADSTNFILFIVTYLLVWIFASRLSNKLFGYLPY